MISLIILASVEYDSVAYLPFIFFKNTGTIWISFFHIFIIFLHHEYLHHSNMVESYVYDLFSSKILAPFGYDFVKHLPCFSFVNTGIIVIIIRYWHHSNMILLHTYHLFPVKILPSFEYGSPTLLLCFLFKNTGIIWRWLCNQGTQRWRVPAHPESVVHISHRNLLVGGDTQDVGLLNAVELLPSHQGAYRPICLWEDEVYLRPSVLHEGRLVRNIKSS